MASGAAFWKVAPDKTYTSIMIPYRVKHPWNREGFAATWFTVDLPYAQEVFGVTIRYMQSIPA